MRGNTPGLTTREGCYKLGKLLSEATPSTLYPRNRGCLENRQTKMGEGQHPEENAHCTMLCVTVFLYLISCQSEEKAERLSIVGYGVNPVGRPDETNKQTNKQTAWDFILTEFVCILHVLD